MNGDWICDKCRLEYDYPVMCCDIPVRQNIKRDNPRDRQEGGDHYAKLGDYQPWIVLTKWMTDEELKGAMKKDVIGYLARESDKGGREDIKKAHHTLGIYLELTEDDNKTYIRPGLPKAALDKLKEGVPDED